MYTRNIVILTETLMMISFEKKRWSLGLDKTIPALQGLNMLCGTWSAEGLTIISKATRRVE